MLEPAPARTWVVAFMALRWDRSGCRSRRGGRSTSSWRTAGVEAAAYARADVSRGGHRAPSGSMPEPSPARRWVVVVIVRSRQGVARPSGSMMEPSPARTRDAVAIGQPSGSIRMPEPARIVVVMDIVGLRSGCRTAVGVDGGGDSGADRGCGRHGRSLVLGWMDAAPVAAREDGPPSCLPGMQRLDPAGDGPVWDARPRGGTDGGWGGRWTWSGGGVAAPPPFRPARLQGAPFPSMRAPAPARTVVWRIIAVLRGMDVRRGPGAEWARRAEVRAGPGRVSRCRRGPWSLGSRR